MSAELELVEAMKILRQELVRLQAENMRLREIISTYPERLGTLAGVLGEVRGLCWQIAQDRGARRPPSGQGFQDSLNDVMSTGIPPTPDERWWPMDTGPTLVPVEETHLQVPEEPEWPREPMQESP